MKTIIAGSRTIVDYAAICAAVDAARFPITEVVCGDALGVDQLGARWATEHGIPIRHFPANWGAHGNAAGPIRNQQMAVYADALIAVWQNRSKGTADIIHQASRRNLAVYVHVIKTTEPSIFNLEGV